MDTRCIECDAKATHKCEQCHVVEYCGQECQKAHWEESHQLVCFSIANPDLTHVNELLQMTYEDEDARELQAIAKTHQNDPQVMYGIAGLIQMAYDGEHETEEIGGLFGRSRRERKAEKKDKWGRKKHSILRYIPGTDSYKAKKRMEKGYAYAPTMRGREGYYKRSPEEFEAERRGY